MDNFLTAEQLRAPGELPSAAVIVEEWGGTVRVRRLTAIERDRYDLETGEVLKKGGEAAQNIRARLVAHCLIGEDGKQLFLTQPNGKPAEIDPAAIRDLGHKDGRGLARVYRIAADLNGLTDEAEDEDDEGN